MTKIQLTRRDGLRLLAAGATTAGLSKFAAAAPNVRQLFKGDTREWQDRFDTESGGQTAVVDRVPMINRDSIELMRSAVTKYETLVQQGGWPEVSTDKVLKLGKRHDAIVTIRKRLRISGDMPDGNLTSNAFDSYVNQGVKRFQVRHGLIDDGVVGRDTVIAMNVFADKRLAQLRLNLNRLEEMAPLENRYVMVNIPGAQIETVEFSSVATRHTAVVGRDDRPTPLLSSAIYQINFNPYWTVPKSIIRKDLIPVMQKDPNYLNDNEIRIFSSDGKQIESNLVNWNSEEALGYRFRQQPGSKNSLGTMRINFANPHSVYLHDTPSKTLFGENYRFNSSGCVRIQNIREFATWLTKKEQNWGPEDIDALVRSGERVDVAIRQPVPLHMVYFTSWATTDKVYHFRDDIYGLDAQSGT
jgi:murein L,D-transpeptidase YcbB/YkuD